MTKQQQERLEDILEACGVPKPKEFILYVILFANMRVTARLLEDAIWLALGEGALTIEVVCDQLRRMAGHSPLGGTSWASYGVSYWRREAATRDGYDDVMNHRLPGSFGTGKRR